MNDDPIAIGVDGCRTGWIAVIGYPTPTSETLRTELRIYASAAGGLTALVDECEAMSRRPVVAVDVPMGLPRRAGLRECDREARAALGRRWPCVFPAPDRELLGLGFEDARALVLQRRAAEPHRANPVMTKQSMAIAPKIAEADELLAADSARQEWLIEVHPELSFLALARALGRLEASTGLPRKKRTAGRAVRTSLIAAEFPDAPARIAAVEWSTTEVARDDILDAYAGLWSALRFVRRRPELIVLGDGSRDDAGILAQMVV